MRSGNGLIESEWYRVVLKGQLRVTIDEVHIRDMFNRAFANRSKPAGMSLWVERPTDGTAVYYLSPVSIKTDPGLVRHLGAVRSTRPPATAYLIAGCQAPDA